MARTMPGHHLREDHDAQDGSAEGHGEPGQRVRGEGRDRDRDDHRADRERRCSRSWSPFQRGCLQQEAVPVEVEGEAELRAVPR